MRKRTLYAILSIGVMGTFFGHGAWAVGAKDSFIGLLTGSMDNVFGYTMSETTAQRIVRGVGVVDITLTVAMAFMLYGAWQGRGKLYNFAYSTAAIGVYAWAVLWGFVTAASRMTAAGVFYPEVWDLVERAPNFMLPAALIYLVTHTRQSHPEAPMFVPAEFHGTPEDTKRLTPH